ncbi:MAG: aminoacyl-histidine dipeptidase [Sphaerochaetaceae bacterium]
MKTIEELKKQNLWKNFLDLEQIPRESGNEAGVRTWLLSWAKSHNLEALADKVGNVIMRKPASKGYETRSSVALQGHMDMVCVKRKGSKHDFLVDPIEVQVDGDFLCAKDTSLGGDDGIAIALILDILTDESLQHGPLEAIFTISEETGLTGAFGIEKKDIKSRKLLNLDSEEEGILYIGCAGGVEVEGKLPVEYQAIPHDWDCYTLTIDGLLGGHSGGEIHKQRANAIKLAARFLIDVPQKMLFSLNGGTKRNVIPSFCTVGFAAPKADAKIIEDILRELSQKVKNEYALNDSNIKISLETCKVVKEAASAKQSESFIRSLFIAPHGVYSMSQTIIGIVETSSNLAIATMEKGQFLITTSHRSSVLSARDLVAKMMGESLRSCGMSVSYVGAYPSWTPNPKSPLAGFCAKAYEEYTGKKMEITAIHAGLECGIINSKIEGMDSVSFGPQMHDIHSVDEHLCISSCERMLGFTKHLLSIIE